MGKRWGVEVIDREGDVLLVEGGGDTLWLQFGAYEGDLIALDLNGAKLLRNLINRFIEAEEGK